MPKTCTNTGASIRDKQSCMRATRRSQFPFFDVVRPLCVFIALYCGIVLGLASIAPAIADETSPFTELPGRWVGQGRLGFKNGEVENIKCRATYFVENQGSNLRQNIRCASASGKVELKSEIIHEGNGKLNGTWKELLYNLSGQLGGQVTKRGFRIKVVGKDLAAHMEIIVKEARQIVEVHFDSATLIGMTLMLRKG